MCLLLQLIWVFAQLCIWSYGLFILDFWFGYWIWFLGCNKPPPKRLPSYHPCFSWCRTSNSNMREANEVADSLASHDRQLCIFVVVPFFISNVVLDDVSCTAFLSRFLIVLVGGVFPFLSLEIKHRLDTQINYN